MRKDELSIFTQSRTLGNKNKYLDSLGEHSIVLNQAISYDGVRGMSRYLLSALNNNSIIRNDYIFINDINQLGISKNIDIMNRLSRYDDQGRYFKKLEFKIQKALSDEKPFILFSHIEFLHFPFANLSDPELLNYLNRQKNISTKDLNERLPFFLALVPYDGLSKTFLNFFKPLSFSDSLSYGFKVFKDPVSLNKWKQNPSFANDIKVLRKFYKTRLNTLDTYLENFLKPREMDSFIYLVGCHGQPFLEQGEFLHGNGIDEGVANIPAFIHMPKMKERINLNQQVGMISIANTIKELVNQKLENDKFVNYAKQELEEKIILQFDCRGQRFAIRYDGKSKYVQDFATGKKEFYNLVNDPFMKRNIIDELSQDQRSFFQNNLYDLFLHKLSSSAKELPSTGYCPYQIKLK
ncbi:MAG: hypothetical protein PHY93_06060 [Bacteriovorax sp.]|nr:hypothetical protein [Bacteriovorax sp.]